MDAAGALGPLSACAVPPVAPARAARLWPEAVTGAGRDRHQGQPCHQPGRDLWSGHRRTMAGVLQSGQAWSRWAAGRIRSDGSSRDSPRSHGAEGATLSSGAVGAQHGSAAGLLRLAGRTARNPFAACPCGSRWPGLTQGSRCSPLASAHLWGVWSVFSAPSQPWPFPRAPSVKSAYLWFTAIRQESRSSAPPLGRSSSLAAAASPSMKMRLMPAEKAFAFARKLQGTPGCTVSVC